MTRTAAKQFEKRQESPRRSQHLRWRQASLIRAAGADLKEIQERLGHADFSTTANAYAPLCMTHKQRHPANWGNDTTKNSLRDKAVVSIQWVHKKSLLAFE